MSTDLVAAWMFFTASFVLTLASGLSVALKTGLVR